MSGYTCLDEEADQPSIKTYQAMINLVATEGVDWIAIAGFTQSSQEIERTYRQLH